LSYYQCDVQDEASVSATFTKITLNIKFPIRGLVACAGISINGPSIEFPVGDFRKILDINVTGIFLVAQATAREVLKNGNSSSFVFVASMSGYRSNKVSQSEECVFSDVILLWFIFEQ
jgi:NAD(P)-dependent dehydrogenase (short-subunit alcohol dehydrogenase family)